ncbi:DNA polymerase III subunit alpha [Candidatus Microgenomates bacterium]|nr:DNA polymerase III subunit alpha [Candidatus Microgenomates bacterium]
MSDFIHLHTHSEYSLLDGLAKIPDLVAKAKEYGMNALALTDHGAMYGIFKFYLACREAGIKPIIGMEAYQASRSRFDKQPRIDKDQHHLVLLAKNAQGYKNLIKLTTLSHLEGFYYKPRIDLELLEKYSEGLICLSACLEGEVPSLLRKGEDKKAEEKAKKLMEIFPEDHFYLEIQHHPKIEDQALVNQKIIKLSSKLGIPLVATNDIHYVEKEDAEAQEILLCVQTQRTILEKNRPLSMIKAPSFYFRSPEEMKGLFIRHPEAIANTVKIAKMCNVEIEMGNWILPRFAVPEKETSESYLRKLVHERLPQRYPKPSKEVLERMEYELDVICKKGFAAYFLIVQDFVNWSKEKGIRVGPGRGSAAGSLVSYVLRITSLDPIFHKIPFERFLNHQRPSPPDIDLDFADDKRDEVIAYVTEKYGKDKVAQIITFGKMEARQAIRDAGRALGMSYSAVDRIAKMIPAGAQGFAMTIDKAIKTSFELSEAYQSEKEVQRLLDIARKLEGVARHSSTHAAGVVIADKDLTEYVPLQKEVKGDRIITQYDMYCLDLNAASEGKAIGLLKMDFLGLRNLTILQNAVKFVQDKTGEKVDLSSLPLNDKKVFEIISKGETTGIFQLESAGMRRLAKDLKPSKFSDISAMVALFRPGPMNWISDFTESKRNPQKIKYPHPDLKPILKETYGIAVYQEQCMQIASTMAGYTLVEADKLRLAIGKKKRALMKKEKEKFINGCLKQEYTSEIAEKVWSLIEKFVGYGFNKAHSASYGMIAYQTAYMKTHYPVEYMTAVLTAETRANSGPTREEKLTLAIEECRRMKIELLPPDINKSEIEFAIEDNSIRFGLSAIKNVGKVAIEVILLARKKDGEFISLIDFCQKVNLGKVNSKTFESLLKAGAFDQFGKRAAMLVSLPRIVDEAQKEKKRRASGQIGLFDGSGKKAVKNIDLPEVEELTTAERLAFEKQLFGFYLSGHPLKPLLKLISSKTTHEIKDLSLVKHKKKVTVGGIITRVKKIITKKNNNEMAFVKISDLTDSIELIVFPRVFAETKSVWINDGVVLVKGKIEEKDKGITLIVDDATSIKKD